MSGLFCCNFFLNLIWQNKMVVVVVVFLLLLFFSFSLEGFRKKWVACGLLPDNDLYLSLEVLIIQV